MKNTSVSLDPNTAAGRRAFGGFPYAITRLVSSLFHVILLPRDWPLEQLLSFTQRQALANRLPTCLVLASDLCVYFREDGTGRRSSEIPRDADLVSEKLAPADAIPESAELSVRRMELILFEEVQYQGPGTKFIVGDITKGGRLPTPEEEERLAGTHADGVPRGLLPCTVCGEWRGECFDTSCRALVVTVCCVCQNDNRCARCGELLNDRKLNANYFDLSDRKIWHVPGFSGLHHRCPDTTSRAAAISRKGFKALPVSKPRGYTK